MIAELLCAADLVGLAYVDARLPVCDTVYATDASGNDSHGFGGYGIVTKIIPQADSWAEMRVAERWR